jgi:hypothetical protein
MVVSVPAFFEFQRLPQSSVLTLCTAPPCQDEVRSHPDPSRLSISTVDERSSAWTVLAAPSVFCRSPLTRVSCPRVAHQHVKFAPDSSGSAKSNGVRSLHLLRSLRILSDHRIDNCNVFPSTATDINFFSVQTSKRRCGCRQPARAPTKCVSSH